MYGFHATYVHGNKEIAVTREGFQPLLQLIVLHFVKHTTRWVLDFFRELLLHLTVTVFMSPESKSGNMLLSVLDLTLFKNVRENNELSFDKFLFF